MKRFFRNFARRLGVFTAAVAIAAMGSLWNLRLVAQEQPAADAKPAEVSADSREDLFTVPEGDADALHAYLEKLAQTEPDGKTQEEQIAFSIKALTSLTEGADRLLAATPSEEQARDAHGYRIQGLSALKNILKMTGGDPKDAQERLEKAIAEARQSEQAEVVSMGWNFYINETSQAWSELSGEQKQAFRDEIMKQIDENGPELIDVSIVDVAAMRLDGQDDAFAVDLLTEAKAKLEKTEDAEIKEALVNANIDGTLRRLRLMGNPMEINGKFLSGDEVKWDAYRGKVVLVDFWASWCGPCKAELPNVLKMYEGYREKGFDVVGVSLDETADAAQSEDLPWDSIFPENEEERGFAHPLARHYGINGIPTAILVDKEGKVVSMNARGPELRAQLKKLLGDPAEKPAEEKAEEAAAK